MVPFVESEWTGAVRGLTLFENDFGANPIKPYKTKVFSSIFHLHPLKPFVPQKLGASLRRPFGQDHALLVGHDRWPDEFETSKRTWRLASEVTDGFVMFRGCFGSFFKHFCSHLQNLDGFKKGCLPLEQFILVPSWQKLRKSASGTAGCFEVGGFVDKARQ